jgi:hypothetical protein
LNYAPVDDFPVRSGLPTVAPLELVGIGSPVPEEELEQTFLMQVFKCVIAYEGEGQREEDEDFTDGFTREEGR